MPLLGEGEETFVRQITARVYPTPDNHKRIAELIRAGAQPEGDPIALEVGANRCAAG